MKRFKRIYTPVFIFLTFFFLCGGAEVLIIGKSDYTPSQVLGSYLLLNNPSIGYVWIMRIFLLMALITPFLSQVLRNASYIVTIITILIVIMFQSVLVNNLYLIENKALRYAFNEIVIYTIGYAPMVVLGLKIKQFNHREVLIILITLAMSLIGLVAYDDWIFAPNSFKYPPRSLYILYGLFSSCLLWSLRPILTSFVSIKTFKYLSKNSMWIYLWHIIPVYLIIPIDWIDNTWVLRYAIVIAAAVSFNFIYSKLISLFPFRMRQFFQ